MDKLMDQNTNKIYNADHNTTTIEEVIEQITLQEPLYIWISNVNSEELCQAYEIALQEKYKKFDYYARTNLELVRNDVFKTNLYMICDNNDEYLQVYEYNNKQSGAIKVAYHFVNDTKLNINVEEIEQFLPLILYVRDNEKLENSYYYNLFKLTYLGVGMNKLLIYIADKKPLVKRATTGSK